MTGQPAELADLARAVDDALAEVAKLDESSRAKAIALRDAIEALAKDGLVKLVRSLRADERGRELLVDALGIPDVYALFLAHEIITPTLAHRVAEALELVKPYLQSHGGSIELAGIEGDIALVRLQGSCTGCSMSAQTLRQGVEDAVRSRVPEIARVQQVVETAVPGLVVLEAISTQTTSAGGWVEGPAVDDIPHGRPAVAAHGAVLIVRDNERIFAYRNECPHMGMPLDGGALEGTLLACPSHGFRYDITSGECVTATHVQLLPVPLRVEGGHAWVRPD
jgi:nitrite reductase/ring-hydroxylating ferredoxin subunit/Fe-S cluster biogenesis protein NfuA